MNGSNFNAQIEIQKRLKINDSSIAILTFLGGSRAKSAFVDGSLALTIRSEVAKLCKSSSFRTMYYMIGNKTLSHTWYPLSECVIFDEDTLSFICTLHHAEYFQNSLCSEGGPLNFFSKPGSICGQLEQRRAQ